MNCYRAFEMDLEDLLTEPASEGYRELEAHSQACPDCAGQLELHRALLGRLRGEHASEVEHPADAALLRLARQPEALGAEERASLRAHLRDCRSCDDAYRATLMLVPERRRSGLARAIEALRGSLSPGPLLGWVPVAAALVLGIGVTLRLDPLGLRVTEPDRQVRGAATPFAAEVEITPSERGALSLYGLDQRDLVQLRLEVPAHFPRSEVLARISLEAEPPILETALSWDPAHGSAVLLEVRAGIFERDSYRIELVPASGPTARYWLDVQ